MPETTIRKATEQDWPILESIFDAARSRMRAEGNASQWVNGYPGLEEVLSDIGRDEGFVVAHNGRPVGYFCLQAGGESTYSVVRGGEWPATGAYLTIHRAAAKESGLGIFRAILDFALSFGLQVRADTHADNRTMLAILHRSGFVQVGEITLSDGTPRLAFYHP